MVKVNVKFGKESLDVENSEPTLSTFQALLFSLTNVPPERQKIMLKGKMLKDDASIAGLKEGDKLVLMGSADAAPQAPQKKIVFEEDLTDAQKIGVVKDLLSAGLHNLGNTCYMASTLQCMRAVPELKQALISKSRAGPPAQHDPQAAVVRQLGSLYQEMDSSVAPITPMMFTTVFRSTFPQFAETNNEGAWMQQDAEEALQQLMNAMANSLKAEGAVAAGSSNQNVIDEYFGGEMETRTAPKVYDAAAAGAAGSSAAAAAPAAAASSSSTAVSADVKTEKEHFRRLRCFIDIETNFLYQGVRAGLKEERELRGQIYERTSTLLTLPRYLIVQMNRFFWRKDTQKKSKILRKVDAPFKFDVIEFAHPTLKAQLSAARNFLKEEQDEKLGLASLNKKAKTAEGQTAGSAAAAAPAESSAPMDVDASSNPWSSGSSSGAAVLTTPTTGNYELFALVTHKGRSADSGHYVSWTKRTGAAAGSQVAGEAKWLKFDDDKVSEVKEDDIKSLHGGGDFDMSYLLFYRRIDDAVKWKGRTLPEVMPAATPAADKKKETAAASK